MTRPRLLEVRLAEHVERLGEDHPPTDLSSVDYAVRDPAAFSRRFGHVLDYMARVELEVEAARSRSARAGELTDG